MLKFIPLINYDILIDGGAVNITYTISLELLFYMAALQKWKPKFTEPLKLGKISKIKFSLGLTSLNCIFCPQHALIKYFPWSTWRWPQYTH